MLFGDWESSWLLVTQRCPQEAKSSSGPRAGAVNRLQESNGAMLTDSGLMKYKPLVIGKVTAVLGGVRGRWTLGLGVATIGVSNGRELLAHATAAPNTPTTYECACCCDLTSPPSRTADLTPTLIHCSYPLHLHLEPVHLIVYRLWLPATAIPSPPPSPAQPHLRATPPNPAIHSQDGWSGTASATRQEGYV